MPAALLGLVGSAAILACSSEPNDHPGSRARCVDHPNVSERGPACAISAPPDAPLADDLTLTAESTWLLEGQVVVGDERTPVVLTIEPGTTIHGAQGSSLQIQRGARIVAAGSADAPIVMTSAEPEGSRSPQDWGGLVINGRAPINHADQPDGSAPGEAGTGRYGGTDPDDSSGRLEYLRIEYAGQRVDNEHERNGLSLQGVGRGTIVRYIQTHSTLDDGIELFGGTVDLEHVVVTCAEDDSLDWSGGWVGRAQFVATLQSADCGFDSDRGIEADNLAGDHRAEPVSNPVISNVTLVGRAGGSADAIALRRGTRGALHNLVVAGYSGRCVTVADAATERHVANGSLRIADAVLHCATGAAREGAAADLIEGGVGRIANPWLQDHWFPEPGSAALEIGRTPSGEFFARADYAGAFDGITDWTAGWTRSP